MDKVKDNSTLTRIAYSVIILCGVPALLYAGRTLFIPLSFGLLVAIITYPSCKWLEKKKFSRTLAVTIVLSLVVLIFISLLGLLFYEINLFLGDIPSLKNKLLSYFSEISAWLDSSLGLHRDTQDALLKKVRLNIEGGMGTTLKGTINATGATAITLFLIPIFAALFLFHRGTFVGFIENTAGSGYKEKLQMILQQSITTYFNFVKGTFFVYCIVGVLNSLGLLLLGIEHAFLFGIVTAFMTIIPYIGIIISAALPISVALITKDSALYALGVIAVFSVVQYLEANIIFPKIVGKQLNLSTWAVLIAIITGTLLWGLAGMILFVPFTAILKLFSDHVEELKWLNILLNRDSGYKGK